MAKKEDWEKEFESLILDAVGNPLLIGYEKERLKSFISKVRREAVGEMLVKIEKKVKEPLTTPDAIIFYLSRLRKEKNG